MGYRKAAEILPEDIIELIQQYVDGEMIYIPRKENHRQEWGSNTRTKQELEERNRQIFQAYCGGMKANVLADRFFLSEKSIQRIIRMMKENR